MELPLLEASGCTSGTVLVSGSLSADSYGAVLQSQGESASPHVLLLGGPTPHVVGNHSDMFRSGIPIAATVGIGLIPSAQNESALCVIQHAVGGGQVLSVSAIGPKAHRELTLDGAVSVASLGTNSLIVLLTQVPRGRACQKHASP